jgi:hypothetical protein
MKYKVDKRNILLLDGELLFDVNLKEITFKSNNIKWFTNQEITNLYYESLVYYDTAYYVQMKDITLTKCNGGYVLFTSLPVSHRSMHDFDKLYQEYRRKSNIMSVF